MDNSRIFDKKMAMNDSTELQDFAYEQQTSGMSSLSLNNNITARSRGNGYVVDDEWLPGVDTVKKIVSEFSLPPVFIKQKAIEFRILWREQNVIALNWDSYFYGACKNKIVEANGEFITAQKLGGLK